MTAIFLSCSGASIVTKFAFGKSNFVADNSFCASLIGTTFKAQKIIAESILTESPELIETIISNPEVRRFAEELWKDIGRLLTDSQEGKSEQIIDYIKSSQERISKNVDLEKSYKKLSTMIKAIEK